MRSMLILQVVCLLFVAVKADEHNDLELSQYLWTETYQEQQAALNSSLIKGIVSTELSPISFGAYMNQDAVLVHSSQRLINIALERAKDPQHRELLEEMSETYISVTNGLFHSTHCFGTCPGYLAKIIRGLYEYMSDAWKIKYPSGIKLDGACSKYLNHLYDMAVNYDAVYFVTAMIPGFKLWSWLGNKIGSKQKSFGVYTQWVEENLDPTYTGYTALEDVINTAEQVGEIDRQLALHAFKKSMESERDFFSSVP